MLILRNSSCPCVSSCVFKCFCQNICRPFRQAPGHHSMLFPKLFSVDICTHHVPYCVENRPCPVCYDRYIRCLQSLWIFWYSFFVFVNGWQALYLNSILPQMCCWYELAFSINVMQQFLSDFIIDGRITLYTSTSRLFGIH